MLSELINITLAVPSLPLGPWPKRVANDGNARSGASGEEGIFKPFRSPQTLAPMHGGYLFPKCISVELQ